jgi:multiple sugar transport system substrate-binding protein
MIAVLLVAACSNTGASPSAAESAAPTAAPASEPAASEPAASEATTGCAQEGDLEMWERSGGNAGMVDALVAAWNEAYPDCKINLTYIPHTEMVSKIAQGIASGEVPDLMGMDLIYAPQFEDADQLVDVTDQIGSLPELETASPGHLTVATYEGRLYGVPLYADVSALFYNKTLFEQAGLDPEKPPTSLAEIREYADAITALGDDIKGYYLPGNCAGCNIFTVGPLMWASGAKIEAEGPGDEPLVGDGVKQVLEWARDMVASGNVHESAQAENGETFHLQFGSGKLGMMGTGNFNITLARDQMVDHPSSSGSRCCRARSRARRPRSSVVTWSSSRRAARASRTRSTS